MISGDSFSGNLWNQWGPCKIADFVGSGQNARLAAKLTGYKIDIIKYSEDPVQFIAEALS
ncbi:MAG: hypothetical protein IIV85_01770, partial [Clostridia bacterium]|nr:hypothetical protein [Clostridia bacterium]